jgi:hypothetical protein
MLSKGKGPTKFNLLKGPMMSSYGTAKKWEKKLFLLEFQQKIVEINFLKISLLRPIEVQNAKT